MGMPTSEEIARMVVLNGRIRSAQDRLRYYAAATAGLLERETEDAKKAAEAELRQLMLTIAAREN